jgi:hypothetical protein
MQTILRRESAARPTESGANVGNPPNQDIADSPAERAGEPNQVQPLPEEIDDQSQLVQASKYAISGA